MSQFKQNQPQAAYAYPPTSTSAFSEVQLGGPYVVPPPVGYPMRVDDQAQTKNNPTPSNTQARGDGFWKGCCAALCCCCVLDACF